MSARRIKIKARRNARKQAASARNSPITPSDILSSSAIDLDHEVLEDADLEFPFPEEAWNRALENYHRIKQAAARPSSATNIDGPQTAPAPKPAAAATPAPTQPAPGQSTGPRSVEGKARSSHNAFKHGLSMPAGKSMTFLPREDSDAHTLLLLQFNQQFVPMTGAEREVVREIVDTLCLARRARDLQTEALIVADHHAVALYLRYETAHQRAHTTAIKTLLAVQKDRRQRNQNHEKWDEPVLWGDLDFIVTPDCAPAMSSASPAAATTSKSPADSDTSFRSAPFKPWSEMTFGAPNAHQTASGNTIEEVKPAA
jgi:hypothetical protein